MNKKELEAFAREAAKGLKPEKDLNEFSQMLTKVAVEAALRVRRTISRGTGLIAGFWSPLPRIMASLSHLHLPSSACA